MWVRVTHDSKPKYRLIHLETGNRIDVIGNHDYHTVSMYVSHGLSSLSRPDMDVHDLAKGSEAECQVAFEAICFQLAQAGQLVA